MQQRKIILFITVLFILSSAYLFWTAKNFNDPDYQKNWWAVYFENPKTGNLDFVIENHSDKTSFHYVITAGNDKIEEKDVSINKGETKKLTPAITKPSAGKVTIQVTSGDDKKDIYKNL